MRPGDTGWSMSDIREYLDVCIGDTAGWLCAASGVPYLTKAGAIDHKDFTPRFFEWPNQADAAEQWLTTTAETRDTWLCPYVMRHAARRAGEAVVRTQIHTDIDHAHLDAEKVRELGGFAVASGRPGNGHVYVQLTETVPVEWHTALCRGLGDHFGGGEKINDNDLLRPPGTFNHKIPLLDPGADPAPVEWLVKP
jgi:hypothetical protein